MPQLWDFCPAGPTWSSTTSEGCVAAVEQACNKICNRLKPHLQEKSSSWATWQATVAEVQEGSGLTPASVMLSAYGFYDGTARDPQGRTTKGDWRGVPVTCMQMHHRAMVMYTSFAAFSLDLSFVHMHMFVCFPCAYSCVLFHGLVTYMTVMRRPSLQHALVTEASSLHAVCLVPNGNAP